MYLFSFRSDSPIFSGKRKDPISTKALTSKKTNVAIEKPNQLSGLDNSERKMKAQANAQKNRLNNIIKNRVTIAT